MIYVGPKVFIAGRQGNKAFSFSLLFYALNMKSATASVRATICRPLVSTLSTHRQWPDVVAITVKSNTNSKISAAKAALQ